MEKYPPNFDAYVVGSDQVWYPTGHLGEDAYFLSFADPKVRIAYSPSLGVSEISHHSVYWLKKGLNGMRFLSVRETTGANPIRELTGRDAEIVVDPTLLISADHWRRISIPVVKPER